ncbi:hypothetical protein VAEKB19_6640017 [Vibrio aestuarianus]|nr:hypothetical protein VAEKB19_6640017 [Vibrio aestuarianus]
MTAQSVVSSFSTTSTTQPSSDALHAGGSILTPTPPKMPLGSALGLPDSTFPGESLLDDRQARKDGPSAKEKLNRTGGTKRKHKGSNKFPNKNKAKIHLASVIGATTLGAILAPFTGGLSLLPTAFIVLFGNASALAVYGGSEFPIGNNGPKKEEPKKEEKATSAPAPAPVGSDVQALARIPANEEEAASSTQTDASTQTVFPFLNKIIQTSDAAGVKVKTKELTEEELREVLEEKVSDKETVATLVANYRANGSSAIEVQVNDHTSHISTAIISVPNEYLPQSDPSAASQPISSTLAQAAPPHDAPESSNGWKKVGLGWVQTSKNTPVTTTQSFSNFTGSSSSLTSIPVATPEAQSFRGPESSNGWKKVGSSWVQTTSTDTPVVTTQGFSSALDSKWRKKRDTMNTQAVFPTMSVIGSSAQDYTTDIFGKLRGIEKLLEEQKKKRGDIVPTKKGKTDIIPRGEGEILAKPLNPSNLSTKN